MSIYTDLEDHFAQRGYKWSFTVNELEKIKRLPDSDDFHQAIDKAVEALYSGVEGSWLEVGGLLVVKTSTGHTIYGRFGDI